MAGSPHRESTAIAGIEASASGGHAKNRVTRWPHVVTIVQPRGSQLKP